jgi:antitoxin (DNA-binding transcriptional repressor) of toxin-antitoxin stability system
MRQIHLTDDGQLATLIHDVERGESVTILRGEQPVAQIIPFPQAKEPTRAERMDALERLTAIMDKGYDMGLVWNGRDELYDRDE